MTQPKPKPKSTWERYRDVPEQYRQACLYTGVINTNRDASFRFNCAKWKLEQNVLYVYGVILDTSDRAEGVTLQVRWTYVDTWIWGGNISWNMRPLREEELEANTSQNAPS
jgi:hypothetical protein